MPTLSSICRTICWLTDLEGGLPKRGGCVRALTEIHCGNTCLTNHQPTNHSINHQVIAMNIYERNSAIAPTGTWFNTYTMVPALFSWPLLLQHGSTPSVPRNGIHEDSDKDDLVHVWLQPEYLARSMVEVPKQAGPCPADGMVKHGGVLCATTRPRLPEATVSYQPSYSRSLYSHY